MKCRQMTKGEIAVVVVKAYPEVEKGGRGQKTIVSRTFPMVNKDALSQARQIVRYAPNLADKVIGGDVTERSPRRREAR